MTFGIPPQIIPSLKPLQGHGKGEEGDKDGEGEKTVLS